MTEALNAFGASQGQAQAILRILNAPGDPGHLEVDDRGNPIGLVTAERERDQAKAERDTARAELTRERDVSQHGSLAKQLAAVTAERDAARAAAGGYDQTTARQRLGEVDEAIDDLVGKMGGRVEGRNELKQKLNTLLSIIHLSRA